jgi:hypothetical protein
MQGTISVCLHGWYMKQAIWIKLFKCVDLRNSSVFSQNRVVFDYFPCNIIHMFENKTNYQPIVIQLKRGLNSLLLNTKIVPWKLVDTVVSVTAFQRAKHIL